MGSIRDIKCDAVAALTPVKLSDYQRGEIKVCFTAAGDYAVEIASKSAEDSCVPADEWVPETVVDVCGPCPGKEQEDLVLTVLEEDVADGGKCCFTIKPCGDFVRFSGDAQVSGFVKDRRPPVNYGCGPTIAG